MLIVCQWCKALISGARWYCSWMPPGLPAGLALSHARYAKSRASSSCNFQSCKATDLGGSLGWVTGPQGLPCLESSGLQQAIAWVRLIPSEGTFCLVRLSPARSQHPFFPSGRPYRGSELQSLSRSRALAVGGSCLERLPQQLSPANLAALSGQLSVSVPPQLRASSWDAFLPAAALTDTFFCQNKMKQT